ncbi:probable serine carboxypeptidase CPVL [Rhipicephalus sanguineus]|uniref:probable serine carboxypeptidase CPVL n=1 Tax=Rhipicephalus sanguineus TaxID=34632 RepID=UPI001893917E|nr:probable serine carboxypeptidase CPVL [Rhipicephalus sanguineus]
MPASVPPAVAAAAAEAGQPHAGTYLKHQPESEELPQGQPLWERIDEAVGRLATTMKGRRIMIIVLLVLLLAVCLALIGVFAVPRNRRHNDEGALYLTPHVQSEEAGDVRQRSVVSMFSNKETGTEAHAGLVTVNETLQSHLFFLHVQARKNNLEAPLLLWLQGGPGSSSLFGYFLENGPVAIDAYGKLYPRESTLCEYANVIYLDQPVGAGFSRTDDLKGYPTSLEEIARDIHGFLVQFFRLFPEYKGRDFYVAGESYGARAAAAIAIRLHSNPDLPVNLRGVISGVGFLGPVTDLLDLSDYYHQLSLLDYQGWQAYATRMDTIRQMVAGNRTVQALQLLFKTAFVSTGEGSAPTMFQRMTGYSYDGNALQSVEPAEFAAYRDYVASEVFKDAVHVGRNAEFLREPLINQQLSGDYLRNVTDIVSTLMDNYRFLAYAGQLDPIFSAARIEEYYRSVEWSRAEQFRHGRRLPFYAGPQEEGLSGYVTSAGDFSFVVVARAGHYPGFDQPRAVDEVMRRFLTNNLTARHA